MLLKLLYMTITVSGLLVTGGIVGGLVGGAGGGHGLDSLGSMFVGALGGAILGLGLGALTWRAGSGSAMWMVATAALALAVLSLGGLWVATRWFGVSW